MNNTLEIIDLCKSYKTKSVLDKVNMVLVENQITALLGVNGAGKSTTIKCITGINNLDHGEIKTFNHRIGVVYDDNGLYLDLTALENMMIFLALIGKKQKEEALLMLENVGLIDEKDTLVRKFSKGMKRRLAIARMIIFDPDILILDEPFDGIDVFHHRFLINYLKRWVKNKNKSILFSSHVMSEIEEFGDRIYILKNGKAELGCSIEELRMSNIRGIDIKLRFKKDEEKLMNIVDEFDSVHSITNKSGLTYTLSCNEYVNDKICDYLVNNNILFDEITLVIDTMESIFLNYTEK